MRLDGRAFLNLFNLAYVGLMGNLMVLLAALPFVLTLWAGPPSTTWPLMAITSPLLAPAMVACFGVFARYVTDGDASVVRTFWTTWRRHFWRALATGVALSASFVVLFVDMAILQTTRVGAITLPLLITVALLALVVALHVLVALVTAPEVASLAIAKASMWLGVRRWYLSLVSVLLLAALAAIVVERPALGLGVALAPVLFVVWWNATTSLRPVLEGPVVTPGSVRAPRHG